MSSSEVRSDQQAVENRQPQLEQLEDIFRSLGELSHKINNPLTAVLGRAQLLRAYPDTDPKILKAAEIIEESAGRIAQLVREVARISKEGREDVLSELFAGEAAGKTSHSDD
jgi:signal transduction histidine kinase